ncbi:stomatin-like protein 2, mitochondrial [Belonocnema kinseyi]|uniref:stomatin-like protein 2, mitochondrial n=1 Tax=Belonocnema kinseyi TaxID=2817044 RepID=UPI00143D34E5|nr:stomatin-like protein 2, mitochondrial [Belonocnema kinseyi]
MINRSRLLARNLGVLRNSAAIAENGCFASFAQPHPVYSLQVRQKSTTPLNTIIMFVPQQEAWIVERMGKFFRILEPGLNVLLPIVDRVKYVQSLKELAIDIPKQSAVTSDNVTLDIDGILYLRVNDPYLASYGVEDPEFAIIQIAQTTMRSELGKISLDKVFQEREGLNVNIVESINKASQAWGITCLRYEIRDIRLPPRIHDAMQMQVEAERKKRASILESEGVRVAEINVAEGQRQARILVSEAQKQEQINKADGEAAAILAIAQSRARGLEIVANSLGFKDGKDAAALTIAEQYVHAFDKLARTNNTLILPSNVGDVSNFVGQAMSIYKHVINQKSGSENQSQITNGSQSTIPVGIESDDSYEYFSDKEEAEKHKRANKRSPKKL